MSDMNGLGLLVGHLLGDYIVQNDWMAANKTNGYPYFATWEEYQADAGKSLAAYKHGHLACFVHCILYTLAVWACSFWWMPWWGVLACFALHFPVDRWRLARKLMTLMRQENFATGVFSPWSIIVVDNTLHLLVLFVIGMLSGQS